MSNAQKTFDLYNQLGILNNCKRLSVLHEDGTWNIYGHFQSNEGRKNAKVASFDNVEDAVDFEVLFEQR